VLQTERGRGRGNLKMLDPYNMQKMYDLGTRVLKHSIWFGFEIVGSGRRRGQTTSGLLLLYDVILLLCLVLTVLLTIFGFDLVTSNYLCRR
jgi:hypothetical protein